MHLFISSFILNLTGVWKKNLFWGRITMKFFLFFFCFIVGTFATNQIEFTIDEEDSCKKCYNISTILFKSFQLDVEVEEQIQFLQEFACPLMGLGMQFLFLFFVKWNPFSTFKRKVFSLSLISCCFKGHNFIKCKW
jgi:hypothetical protein